MADIPRATRLFRMVVAASMALRGRMDARLAEVGLTTQQAAVLTFVESQSAPPTQGQIASFLGTSHQNVRQLLNGLERKGLVRVRVDPRDRRSRRVVTTSAVGPLFADRDEADHRAVRDWLSALSEDEIEQMCRLLGRVLDDLARRDA